MAVRTTQTQRIALLMAKADNAGTEEEAQLFYAKAEELMLKHAIDRAAVEAAAKGQGANADEPIIKTVVPFNFTLERWKSLGLYGAQAVVEAIGLNDLAINNRGHFIILYGREKDNKQVQQIVEAAWRQAEANLKVWRKSDPDYLSIRRTFGSDHPLYYSCLDGYVLGFAKGAAAKIREAKARFEHREMGSELVLRNQMVPVKEAMAHLKASRNKPVRPSQSSMAAGYRAGKAANLNAEVTR